MAPSYRYITLTPDLSLLPSADLTGPNAASQGLMSRHQRWKDFYLLGRVTTDDSWAGGNPPTQRYLFYFHGSGWTGYQTPTETNFFGKVLAAGIAIVQVMWYGESGDGMIKNFQPWVGGAGLTYDPYHLHHNARYGIWVEACRNYLSSLPAGSTAVFFGQSMGASALQSWLAGCFSDMTRNPVTERGILKGLIANGSGLSAYGGAVMTHPYRQIQDLCQFMARNNDTYRSLHLFPVSDEMVAPDVGMRLQQAIPVGSVRTYVGSVTGSHTWWSTDHDTLLMWINQLFTDAALTRQDGITPLSAGPPSAV